MTMQELLLEAVEQRLLRHLDVQFAIMVAGEQPAVMLAAAILSNCLRLFSPVLPCWASR